MQQIPHTIFAPSCNRPSPGRIMREATAREDNRKAQRREWWLSVAAHALTFLLVVLGTIALSIV